MNHKTNRATTQPASLVFIHTNLHPHHVSLMFIQTFTTPVIESKVPRARLLTLTGPPLWTFINLFFTPYQTTKTFPDTMRTRVCQTEHISVKHKHLPGIKI